MYSTWSLWERCGAEPIWLPSCAGQVRCHLLSVIVPGSRSSKRKALSEIEAFPPSMHALRLLPLDPCTSGTALKWIQTPLGGGGGGGGGGAVVAGIP